jgi:magnesium transporter
MISCLCRDEKGVKVLKGADHLREAKKGEIVWVDLVNAQGREREIVEEMLAVELFTRQEAEEIESSSRYAESEEEISANSNFLAVSGDSHINDPVSFILKDDILITQRNYEFKSFDDAYRKLRTLNRSRLSGANVFLTIFESRIDYDADFLEGIAKDISRISKELTIRKNLDEHILIKINNFQELTMMLRENIIDKQRIISSILKSEYFPLDEIEKLRIMLKDTGSLLNHTSFNFERLEYLQNTFLGLIDIDQNKIIKIFTVVTVIFMPPTLIASMYGMNFRLMPELSWKFGYPVALLIMIMSSVFTFLIFKWRKWL